MRVFKFGGASVKDAEAVKNVASILGLFPDEKIVVVISAMGKTTNALERLTHATFKSREKIAEIINEIKEYHFSILTELFPDGSHPVYSDISNSFVELDWATEDEPVFSYDQTYDQIVSVGELISTRIVSAYLNSCGVKNRWQDARDFIQTDNTYREGKVDWELTEQLAKEKLHFKNENIIITQGFIGGTSENFTTTLGREGSDYTASIVAFALNADDVTIWKDVPGVLNADPKYFDDTVMLEQLSYQDAIELTYYGATVIHPKTIKPLQNKNIPLRVKSFIAPQNKGTVIDAHATHNAVPCFIFKTEQMLISISPKDFSFIVEENLSHLFSIFATCHIKINLMQNSAISFSICVDNNERKAEQLIEELQQHYKVLFNANLELITIRNYDAATIDRVSKNKHVILEQKSRTTVQLVTRRIEN
ncbi:MAG: aspartate kinase [Bacteroidetes bacterium]|nr:aspartate kinase [Bacteroidota bacterium]